MDRKSASTPDRTPLVTVGIPTYNRPEGLDRTLRNIRNQTYANLEIIISDNCSSTLDSAAVAAAHCQADPRVRYVRQPSNIGIDANFKYLLEHARGEYFVWAADDDECTEDFIAVCMAHIGTAGSVMTGMRNSIRSRGLLRWKPPLELTQEQGAFANAVAFFNNAQPSLFYGMHRTKELRVYLQEFMYDYYDYFFILRQILTVGFNTAPQVCFHIGIDSDAPVYKPAKPQTTSIYRYGPFLKDALRATFAASSLSFVQKIRLAFVLLYVGANEVTHFERTLQPTRTKFATAAKWLMRLVRPLFNVPLPAPPPTMKLPTDPEDLCTMFIPHANLQDREILEATVESTRTDLLAKLNAVFHLEAGAIWIPRSRVPRTADDLLQPPSPGMPLDRLRSRLGSLLMQMELQEAYLQKLIRLQKSRLRRAA